MPGPESRALRRLEKLKKKALMAMKKRQRATRQLSTAQFRFDELKKKLKNAKRAVENMKVEENAAKHAELKATHDYEAAGGLAEDLAGSDEGVVGSESS